MREPKPKEALSISVGNIQMFDWRAISFFNRVKMAIAIIVYGKLNIIWKHQEHIKNEKI